MHFKTTLVWLLLGVLLSTTSQAFAQSARVFVAELESLNDSGVTGRAVLIQQGNRLRVNMVVRGLEAMRIHPQHIHGLLDENGMPSGDATCPPPWADANNDGILTVGEGLPFYGPVAIPLLPFSTPVRRQGAITYQQVFDTTLFPRLGDLENHVIVLHGQTLTGIPAIDNPLPVACGEIRPLRKHED